MKLSSKLFKAFLICITAMALTVSCVTEEEQKYEGTKLVVSQWPEGVSRITLKADNSTWTLFLEEAKEVMASEYFTGKTVITVYYDRLDDNEYDEYFGYGIRSGSENPFKVFINRTENSEEASNEAPLATTLLGNETVEVNARTDYFRTSFNITGVKTVELTFENSPEKIKNKDLRLYADTIYAYIDPSALNENFKSVSLWEDPSFSGSSAELPRIGRKGLYVLHRFTPGFCVELTVKDNYYISADDFTLSVPSSLNVTDYDSVNIRHLKFEFTSSGPGYVPAGTVITVSGGTVTAYEVSAFAGKSLILSENISQQTAPSSASLTLTDNSSISAVSDPIVNLAGGRTFFLTIDGTSWSGIWTAVSSYFPDDHQTIRLKASGDGEKLDAYLIYYESGLNFTPGPCWSFISSSWHFILKEGTNAIH